MTHPPPWTCYAGGGGGRNFRIMRMAVRESLL